VPVHATAQQTLLVPLPVPRQWCPVWHSSSAEQAVPSASLFGAMQVPPAEQTLLPLHPAFDVHDVAHFPVVAEQTKGLHEVVVWVQPPFPSQVPAV